MINSDLKQKKLTQLYQVILPRIVGFLAIAMVGIGLGLSEIYKIDACSMCISQRIAFVIVGIGYLIWNKVGYGILTVGSLLGIWLSARHSYIILYPDKAVNSCGAGLQFLWDVGQYKEWLNSLMMGGVDCAHEKFTLLGLSIPNWGLIMFIFFAMIALFLIMKGKHVSRT